MAAIKIPSVPPNAYNEGRPANALLLSHVLELEKAVRKAGRRVQPRKVKTEAEVAAYMRHLNRALYQQVLLPAIKRKPLRAPKARKAAKTAKARKTGKTRKATKAGKGTKRGRR